MYFLLIKIEFIHILDTNSLQFLLLLIL